MYVGYTYFYLAGRRFKDGIQSYTKENVNVLRVGVKIVSTVIGLWVSGYMIQILGSIMNCNYSPFYKGLTLIGWTLTDYSNVSASTSCAAVYPVASYNGQAISNVITATSGSGVLAVVGLLAIVWIVFEFVDISM